ncbi:MAG TPA: radical SAM protein, partial [Bacteroidales bacterium]|nr:radical SAM protein [Bacteroidales bacterium]
MEKKCRRNFLKSLAYIPGMALAAGAISSELVPKAQANTPGFVPSYLRLHRSGELKARGEILWEKMRSCTLCPRMCKINRLRGQRGDCRANSTLEISSAFPHFGEEPELVGNRGSGAIFFTNCPLNCVFCINYEVSQQGHGRVYTIAQLANMMLLLQRQGCHN